MTGIKLIAVAAAMSFNGAMLSQTINHSTSITVAMFLGGIGLTATLVWWVGTLVASIRSDIHDLKRDVDGIEKKMDDLYCVREAHAKCKQK